MTARPQAACRAEWTQWAARLRAHVESLPEGQPRLHARPAVGGWSAAEVLEHLVLATGSYEAVMRLRVEGVEPASGPLAWRPTLAGRLLAWSMTSRHRFPAPRGWRPGPAPRPHVCEAFARELQEVEALLQRSAGLPWNRLRFGSPEAAFLRLNLGDGFVVVLAHTERHLAQIDRALAAAAA